jgi:hypothetical protein
MKEIRVILGTWQLRVLRAAVSPGAANHHHTKSEPVDMCRIAILKS